MRQLAVILASILLVACSSTPKTEPSKGSEPGEASKPAVATKSPSTDAPAVSAASLAALNVETNATANMQKSQEKSVYFDFDSFAVKPEYRDIVMRQAEVIKQQKDGSVVLEGNADERGSSEYNLALGDKRASAVKKSLLLLGIPASKIKVISLGEEKPRLTCHEEKCWRENRRVDFVPKHF